MTQVMLAYSVHTAVSRDDWLLGFADSLYFSGFDPNIGMLTFCVDGHEELPNALGAL
jgi:hypothetical protein